MTPRLYHQLEKVFKQAYLVPLTFFRYGAIYPHRAKLHGCANWIYIDPNDACATKKVVHEPLRGKVSTNLVFWREMLAQLQPDLAVDVGVNYGECLFGANYSKKTKLFGFEANPRLIPYLENSRREHPNGQQMTIVNCLVSDTLAENAPFVVNPLWSGQSSALTEVAGIGSLEFKLPARPLDAVVGPALQDEATMLFKMDIEGYESRALSGFQQTLTRAKQAVGIIEFTSQFIRWAGQDPATYFNWLKERFLIFRFAQPKKRRIVRVPDYAAIPFRHNEPACADADLILVSKTTTANWLPAGWQISR